MGATKVANEYLKAFYSGDLAGARATVIEDFSFSGPFVQTSSRDAFFQSASPLARGAGRLIVRRASPVDQAGVSFLREARARTTSVGEAPIANTDLRRRSTLTEGSPDSIFATRD